MALWEGLKVAVLGMLVVFLGLVILIGCIKLMQSVMAKSAKTETKAAEPAETAAAVEPVVREYVPGEALKLPDPRLYAVLTAAVAAQLEQEGVNPEGGFVIRSVKAL